MSVTSVDIDIVTGVLLSVHSFFDTVLERDDRDALPRLRGGAGGGAVKSPVEGKSCISVLING